MDIPPPLFGDALKKRLTEKIVHVPIIENLLYEHGSLMISSQPGLGKSSLSLQAALQASNGALVFGALPVKEPVKIWYIQMERDEIESLERLQSMMEETGLNVDNFVLDTELQVFNFLHGENFHRILDRGAKIAPKIVFIDPLYGLAPGLSRDEVGSNLVKLFTLMKQTLGCALWINHHTVKHLYEIVGNKKELKDDPFYGAQWLKAHVTGSYFIQKTENGTEWILKKDSYSMLFKNIKLCYDEETYLSGVQGVRHTPISENTQNLPTEERYKNFLNLSFSTGNRKFTFSEAMAKVGCAPTTLRTLNRTPYIKDALKLFKSNGEKTLYEVKHLVP